MNKQNKNICIHVCDDNPVVIEKAIKITKDLLNDERLAAEIVAYEDGNQFTERYKERKDELLILDIDMPGKSGLDILKEFEIHCKNNRVILLRSIYSDSPIINAVFHNKMSICKEKGIDISCNITGSVKCLDDMGVGSILFNLLDNAIEACEKNKKEKRIVCQIAREADEVNIFLENSIDQSVLAENPSFETTKDKKDQHGMGHLIVEEQVKRLGGMVEYYEDEMFCAHIYLPM